jgi:M6 family metalloprotease-like protein
MNTGIRIARPARLGLLAAVAFVAQAFASGAAPAQDIVHGDGARRAEPRPQFAEALRRDPTAFEFRRAWRQKTERVRQARAALERREGVRLSVSSLRSAGASVTGTFRVPVIMGLYAGRTAPYAREQYQERLFGTGTGAYTARTFYSELSRGAFTMAGTVTPWLGLPREAAYYEPVPGTSDDYGRTGEFLRDALLAADAAVDFGQYDNDGPDGVPNSGDDDGYVDAAAFVYPASGKSCGGTGIWPHRWVYAAHWGAPFTTGDARAGGGTIRVDDYLIQGGLACDKSSLMEIGTFSHEMGHALGLPDLYDTNPSNGYSEGVGEWDLMGSGGYRRPMSPAHMGAWSKDFLGWVSVETVTATRAGYTLPRVYDAGTVLRYDLPGTREYFLLEHRQASGSDAFLAGPGLLVYHVDGAVVDAGLRTNRVNAGSTQGVDVEEADGLAHLDEGQNRGDAGDPFPGSTGRATFGAAGTPGSRSNRGAVSGLELRNIRLTGGALTFDLAVEAQLTASVSPLRLTAGPGRTATGTVRITAVGATSPVTVSAQGGPSWLTVAPAAGTTAPADFTVTAAAAGLPAGTHQGTLTFSQGASGSPLQVPVLLTVTSGLALGDSLSGALTSQDDMDMVELNLTAGDTVDVGVFAISDTHFTPSVVIYTPSGAFATISNVRRTSPNVAVRAGYAATETGTYRVQVSNSLRSSNYDGRTLPYIVRTRRSAPVLYPTGVVAGLYALAGSAPRADTLRVYNRGMGSTSFTVKVEGGEGWLTVTPSGATLAPGTAAGAALSPAAAAAARETSGAAPSGTAIAGSGALRRAPGAAASGASLEGPAGAPNDPPALVVFTRNVSSLAVGEYMAKVTLDFPDDPFHGGDETYFVRARVHPSGSVVLDTAMVTYPGHMALAPDGKLVISSLGELERMDPQTGARTTWVSGLDFNLGGMEFGADSALYVAGDVGRKVLRVSPAGAVTTLFTTTAPVRDVAVAPDGTVFAAVAGAVLRRSPNGEVAMLAALDSAVFGIAYHDGYVYYTTRSQLRRVNPRTRVDELRGPLPSDAGELLNLEVGRSGRLYGTENHITGSILVMDDTGKLLERIWGPGQGFGLQLGEGMLYATALAPYPRDMTWRRAVDDGPAPRGALVGDPSGDGQITSMDALGVLSFAVGKPLPAGWSMDLKGDANCDGEVTAVDALIILSRVVQKDVGAFCIGSRR